jgi:hypothetical protein
MIEDPDLYLTNGSESRRFKNIRILRIRIHNTGAFEKSFYNFIILIKPGLKWAREQDPRKSLQPEKSVCQLSRTQLVLGIRISQIRI